MINQPPTPNPNQSPIIKIAITLLISLPSRTASSLVVMPARNRMQATRVWGKKAAITIRNQDIMSKEVTKSQWSTPPSLLSLLLPRANIQAKPFLLVLPIKFPSQAQTLTSLITSSLSTKSNITCHSYPPHEETPSEMLEESSRKAE